jgi:translocation and assembly module TamB
MAASIPAISRKRRRWPKVLFGLFVLFVLAVGFAPWVVSNTSLKDSIVAAATKDVKGTVRVDSLSLGWLSPVEARGVTVTDEAGQEFITVERVTLDSHFVTLAKSQDDLGRIRVEGAFVHLVLTKDSSNLEDAFSAYLAPTESTARTALTLIVEGKATVTDAVTKQSQPFTLTGEVHVPASVSEPIAIATECVSTHSDPAGTLKAAGTMGPGGRLAVEFKELPISVAGWVARRFEPGLSLAGTAAGHVNVHTKASGVALDGYVRVANALASNDYAGDVFTAPEISAELDLDIEGSVFRSKKMLITTPAGTVSWVGPLDMAKPPTAWLETSGLEITAKADAAKLPALLPGLRTAFEGTDVKSGTFDLRVASAASANGTAWSGTARVTTLTATRRGVPVVWEDPLKGEFEARIGPDGFPTFDKLQVAADFIGLNARGSWDRFEAAANLDLDRLSRHLNEFLDLGGAKLAGKASLTAWNRPGDNGTMALAVKGNVERFAFSDGVAFHWQEPSLTIDATAAGQREANGAIRVDRGTATLSAGGDTAIFELTRPIPNARTATAGAARASVSGDLAKWRARLASVVSLPAAWQLAGAGKATAAVTLTEAGATAEAIDLNLTNVQFRGAGVVINDPRAAATIATATWDRKTGSLSIRGGKFGSAEAAGECPSLTLSPGPKLDGTVTITAARLNAVAPLIGLTGDAVDGMAKGSVHFQSTGGSTTFDTTLAVEQFRYGSQASPIWTEPKVDLAAKGTYDPAGDSLSLSAARFAVDGLTANAKGTVGTFSTTQQLDLTGTLDYDLARVEPKVRDYLGKGGAIAGKGSRPFRISGSLSNGPENLTVKVGGGDKYARLNGDASVGWQSARAYGFDVGAADLKAAMEKGLVSFEPVRTSFGGGRADLRPALDIRGGAYDLTFAPGRVIERARLTPAACADALGFALPAIANSTDAEGFVSLDWDDGRIPLADYTKMNAKGRLAVHSLRVVPGPIVREILAVTGVNETSFGIAGEQTVNVWVENGRVHHSNFAIGAKNYTVKTSGSVGFDGSLQLTCEIPIPPKAIEQALRNFPRVREAMGKRTIGVSLAGTVTRPQLDVRAFQANLQKMFADATKDAVGGLLQDEIGKGLDKLLKPPPPKKP